MLSCGGTRPSHHTGHITGTAAAALIDSPSSLCTGNAQLWRDLSFSSYRTHHRYSSYEIRLSESFSFRFSRNCLLKCTKFVKFKILKIFIKGRKCHRNLENGKFCRIYLRWQKKCGTWAKLIDIREISFAKLFILIVHSH
jgi:hypothetical protein